MKVNQIQNSTSFGAKLNIKYGKSYCYHLADKSKREMDEFVETIGNAQDTISIIIEAYKAKPIVLEDKGKKIEVLQKAQEIVAESKINGKTKKESIGYNTGAEISPPKLIESSIWNYLSRFATK